MTLLRAADLSLSFGPRTIFDGLTLVIEENERVGLVGVNGSGKSTLMKILAGVGKPDGGELQLRRGTRVTYLPQEPEFSAGATVASELSSGWDTDFEAKRLLHRLGVTEWDRPVDQLSGGLRKRVAIARALLTKPDLLLLDEPTNHLDADTTEWLEEELDALPGALLLVTHDRYFLDGLVDRIVELGDGKAISYPGNYQAYLEQKLVAQAEAKLEAHKRQRWIVGEVAWLRKGPSARRTKNKHRVERARKLLTERGFKPPEVAALQTVAAPRLGRTVIEAEKLSKRFGNLPVLTDVSLILQSGERIGLVGRNGVGKTTFLRVLLGEVEPDGGVRTIGKNTKIAYYDQSRVQLDPEQTVLEAACDEDHVELGGKRIAVRDYLEDLLFPVPMQRMKVGALSGGERNRLLLARLFLEGANVLVLDEPTNDLDIVTLNVLEQQLMAFGGSVLLVTHDRYFLDKVATSILAFEGEGKVVRYEGNFETYRRLKPSAGSPNAGAVREKPQPPAPQTSSAPKKLGYLEQRELDGMEAAIEAAEAKKAELEKALADPALFAVASRVQELSTQLEQSSAEVDRLYARWEVLSARRDGK